MYSAAVCRFVVRDFVYDEKEITEERQEHIRLMDEKKMQFVSYCEELSCFTAFISVSFSEYATSSVHCL